jgi:hypothetical protein
VRVEQPHLRADHDRVSLAAALEPLADHRLALAFVTRRQAEYASAVSSELPPFDERVEH